MAKPSVKTKYNFDNKMVVKLDIKKYIQRWLPKSKRRDVALVLGGGGARGYAHIGAIEVLKEHGFHITSVVGTSMGALVGGLFAAGKLDELRRIVENVSKKQIISLVDLSIGLDHIATAERLRQLLDEMKEGIRIEDLPMPFCCCTSDLVSGKEVVIDRGPLSEAIRASISIPGIFSPVRKDGHVFVDGSLHNTLPLNRVKRHKGDLLIAVNASAPDTKPFKNYSAGDDKQRKSIWERLKNKLPMLDFQFSENYVNMIMRVCQVSVQNNTQMAMEMTKPDICVDVPMDSFGLLDFERGREIIDYGRREMERVIKVHGF